MKYKTLYVLWVYGEDEPWYRKDLVKHSEVGSEVEMRGTNWKVRQAFTQEEFTKLIRSRKKQAMTEKEFMEWYIEHLNTKWENAKILRKYRWGGCQGERVYKWTKEKILDPEYIGDKDTLLEILNQENDGFTETIKYYGERHKIVIEFYIWHKVVSVRRINKPGKPRIRANDIIAASFYTDDVLSNEEIAKRVDEMFTELEPQAVEATNQEGKTEKCAIYIVWKKPKYKNWTVHYAYTEKEIESCLKRTRRKTKEKFLDSEISWLNNRWYNTKYRWRKEIVTNIECIREEEE